MNATEFNGPQGSAPKHFFCISVKVLPCGDHSDIIKSSRRDTSEKNTLTDASVTAMPVSRILRSEELQMKADVFEEIVFFEQLVVRGITAKYTPKFEPETVILLRSWEVTTDCDGVL